MVSAALLVFYAVGMQNRIAMWHEAREIAYRTPHEMQALRPALPPGATLVTRNVPDMHQHALVYISGLQPPIALQYPGVDFILQRKVGADTPIDAIIFDYSGGHIHEITRSLRS
jgi:hypothetical protein